MMSATHHPHTRPTHNASGTAIDMITHLRGMPFHLGVVAALVVDVAGLVAVGRVRERKPSRPRERVRPPAATAVLTRTHRLRSR
jgi:hypothetical protein